MTPAKHLDERVDAYIKNAQPFAQPILKHLRKLVHKSNSQIQETIKWSFPCYDYKGIVCSMAAFKEHVSFGFWKAALLNDPNGYLHDNKINGGEAMGNFGRIKSLTDLPEDEVIIEFIQQAIDLNERNIKLTPTKKSKPVELDTPEILIQALKKNKKAAAFFEKLSPSHKKEYILWIEEAKTEPTKIKRLQTTIEWLSEEKNRNWKYEKK